MEFLTKRISGLVTVCVLGMAVANAAVTQEYTNKKNAVIASEVAYQQLETVLQNLVDGNADDVAANKLALDQQRSAVITVTQELIALAQTEKKTLETKDGIQTQTDIDDIGTYSQDIETYTQKLFELGVEGKMAKLRRYGKMGGKCALVVSSPTLFGVLGDSVSKVYEFTSPYVSVANSFVVQKARGWFNGQWSLVPAKKVWNWTGGYALNSALKPTYETISQHPKLTGAVTMIVLASGAFKLYQKGKFAEFKAYLSKLFQRELSDEEVDRIALQTAVQLNVLSQQQNQQQ